MNSIQSWLDFVHKQSKAKNDMGTLRSSTNIAAQHSYIRFHEPAITGSVYSGDDAYTEIFSR